MAPRKRAPTSPEAQAKRNENLKYGRITGQGRQVSMALTAELSETIRAIGEEVIDEQLGWRRIDAVIRRLYQEAMGGKIQAIELLMDRGWGRVPTTVELDISGEVRQLVLASGIPIDKLKNDPLLRELLASSNLTIEGIAQVLENGNQPRQLEAPESEGEV